MSSDTPSIPEGESPPQNIEDISEQLEQQQAAISQLKEISRKTEEELMTKKKAAEEFASKLSGIKSRSKGFKRGSRTGDEAGASHSAVPKVLELPLSPQEAEIQVQQQHNVSATTSIAEGISPQKKTEGDRKETPTSGKSVGKSRKGNLQLLRKKLEENRLKFEQEKSSFVDSKQVEEKVEQLRVEIGQVVQDLQKTYESTTVMTQAPVKIKHTVEQVPQQPVESMPPQQEMYAQMVYKDNKILDLNNRITQLETNILDLQENLKEKDAVIDARTRAIKLMSEDLSRKGKTTVDSLFETREQMKLMQQNFIALESQLKEEVEQLNKQLEAKDRKLRQSEESNQKLESVRYNLSTRIAELQSKVVNLQTQNTEFQKLRVGGAEESRVEDLLRQLDEANKQAIKMKAQHRNKTKQLTKQLDSLRKVSDASGEILQLQQRVAELEEDKGNLQLHLVDFDELKASEERCRLQIQELEEKVKQQSRDLDSHLHALSLLEAEKLDLMQGLQEERHHISSLVTEMEALRANILDLENLKVAAEMKAIELEEQVDIISREKQELKEEFGALGKENSELKQQLDILMSEKSQIEEHSQFLAQEREDLAQQLSNLWQEKELSSMQASTLLAEADTNRSFQMLSSKEGEDEKWKRVSMSDDVPAEKHVKDSSNHELSLKLLEVDVEELRKTIAQQEDIIADLNSKLQSREEDIEMQQELISKLEQLAEEVGMVPGERNEDANEVSKLAKEVQEMAGDLEEWKNKCSEVQDRLKCLEIEKDAIEKKLEEVTNENSVLSSQLRLKNEITEEAVARVNDQLKVIADKNEIISQLEKVVEETRELLSSKDSESSAELSRLQGEFDMKCKELESTNNQIENFNKFISEQDSTIKELSQKCKQLEDSQLITSGSSEEVKKMLDEKLMEIHELSNDLELTRSVLRTKDEELATMKQELEVKTAEMSSKDEAVEKTEQKMKEQMEKMKKIAANLKAKTVIVRGHEEREIKLKSSLEEKEKTILELTETFQKELEEKTRALEALSEKYVVQETSLRSNETKIEGLTELVNQQNGKIAFLEGEKVALIEELEMTRKLSEEHEVTLRNQITELEREMSILQIDLRNRMSEVERLKEEKQEGEKEEHNKYESIVDELNRLLSEKDTELEVKLKSSEQIIVSKDMELSALQGQLSNNSERFQQSRSAVEAKLQEREAFIESLEQDLARSRERERHLEEGLSNFEERRRSLESKYEALGERLQESDRIKEEKEEQEDMLELRLTALMTSEDNLRRKLDDLGDSNNELTQKVTELAKEKEELKRIIVESENTIKMSNKEVERLSSFEIVYNQSLEKIQHLEAELKHSAVEFERSHKEKLLSSQNYIENLELDLKNVNSQVQLLETEKHALMEHCEKLNDLKCNLEEEIEELSEKNNKSKNKIEELQNEILEKQLEMDNALKMKEQLIAELNVKISSLEDKTPVEKEQSSEDLDHESKIIELTSQVSKLTKNLAQKDSELNSYQSRLLQLQFGGATTSGSQETIRQEIEKSFNEKMFGLNEINRQLEEKLAQKNKELQDSHSRMYHLESEIVTSHENIQKISSEMVVLQKEIDSRKDKLKEDELQTSTIKTLRQELDHLSKEYRCHVSALCAENSELYKDLIREKAAFEIDNILSVASNQIRERTTLDEVEIVPSQSTENKDAEKNVETDSKEMVEPPSTLIKVHQLASELPHPDSVPDLEDKLSELTMKLECVKEERDVAILRLDELTLEYVRSQELESTLNELQSERDSMKMKIEVLTSEHVRVEQLETRICELGIDLESLRNERDVLNSRIEEMNVDLVRLQEVEMKYQELQHNYNCAMATIELLRQKSSTESEDIGDKTSSSPDHSISVPSVQADDDGFRSLSSIPSNIEEASNATELKRNVPPQTVIDFGSLSWEEVTAADDGWGWGSDEARLEEEHLKKQQQQETTSPEASDQLQAQISELQCKLSDLQLEKEKLSQELKQSQINSGTQLRKIKNLRLKNENLMKENQSLISKRNDLSDLDSAIEEELKLRIDSLEKELKDCTNERDNIRSEKEILLKRVDTLTAANERFMEMKERQDIDVGTWQHKNKELMNQVETLEWKLSELSEACNGGNQSGTIGGFADWGDIPPQTSANEKSNVNDLQEQLSALAADNEHLQSILEDQRNLRIAAEATIKELERKIAITVQEEEIINALREEIAILRENQRTSSEDQANLFEQEEGIVDTLREENAKLREKLQDLEQKTISSEEQGEGIVDILRTDNVKVRENYEALYVETQQLRSSMTAANTLESNYEYLQIAHERLGMEMNSLQESYRELETEYEKVRVDLQNSSQRNDAITNEYEKLISDLQKSTLEVQEEYTTLVNELQDMAQICYELIHSYDVVRPEHESMEQKLISLQDKYFPGIFVQMEKSSDRDRIRTTSEKETKTDTLDTSTASTMTEREQSEGIEEKQTMIIELRNELKKKTAEMDVLREMISSEQQERADTENELNYMISSLQSELEMSRQNVLKGSDSKEILKSKEEEISSLNSQLASNTQLIERMNSEIQHLTSRLSEKETFEMEYKTTHESLLQNLSTKDQEIQNLQIRFAEKEREANEIQKSKDEDIENLKLQISERERQVEELLYVKDEDIENLRIQISELERRTQENLDIKDKEIYNLQLLLTDKDKKIYELSQMLDDEIKQVAELQELLDRREDELKELIRAGPSRDISTVRHSQELAETKEETTIKKEEEEQLEEVLDPNQNQSELDLALYMLHQRDVRCDELTLELMQLLEERDTLQLRLSSALKINEDLRVKINKTTSTTSSPVRVPVALLTSSSSESSRGGEGSTEGLDQILMPIEPQPLTQHNVIEEPTEDFEELANKLSQLHRVDYRRDVTVHEERQQRHSEQMQLLQQRGAGIVVESNYTLSRDVQSPSTVLLNWIWGRSTPRVMHI